RTTDTGNNEKCRKPPNQSAAFYNSHNVHQPQRQFAIPNNFLNACKLENQILVPYNYPTVNQPQWQVRAPYSIAHVLGRERLSYLKRLYGPVFEDCDEVRRKIREYISTNSANVAKFARAINVYSESLRHFLNQKGFDNGAGSIAYPATYYYFEKMRMDHEEEKSEHRLWSEKHYPHGYKLRRSY
ncbi:hypothetical protein Bhyg_12754, partial [Pseudolycoriella hygida]